MNANSAGRQDMDRRGILARGHAALRAGDINTARACFAALRARHSDDPDALHGLACVALAAGRPDLAITLAGQAVRLSPQGPFHEVLARALLVQGHHMAAQAAIRAACMCQPDDVPVLLACAEIMEATGDPWAAAEAYVRAVTISPAPAVQARRLHARFLWRRGQRDAAIQQMHHMIRRVPDPVLMHELAEMLLAHRLPEQAEAVVRAVVAHDPDDGVALSLLGTLLFARGRMRPAAAVLERAMAHGPTVETCSNLGLARMALGDMRGAGSAFAIAMRLRPDDARIALNHATGLFEGGNVMQAATVYETILAHDPPPDRDTQARARFNLGVACLAQGKLRQGWKLWESRLDFLPAHPSASRLPRWDGHGLPAGWALLVHVTGQGLGDAVHFLRYVPLAARRVPVVLEVPASLRRLAATLGQGETYPIKIITHNINDSAGSAAQCDLFSLPHLLGADSVPPFRPYLGESPWRQPSGRKGPLRVGLCHAGNAAYRFDARRSIPVEDLSALGEIAGIEFISLRPQAVDMVDPPFVRHELPSDADLMDTARLIATLDLVISVDTLSAHLAGAMGCPVWLLCRFGGDWRWSPAFDLPVPAMAGRLPEPDPLPSGNGKKLRETSGFEASLNDREVSIEALVRKLQEASSFRENTASGNFYCFLSTICFQIISRHRNMLPPLRPASQWYPNLRLFRQASLLPPQQAWTPVMADLCRTLRVWAAGWRRDAGT
ncbi:tetratricopeptide repeat protein [Komagataeibacter diospyri]|uniref:O-linked N-acetylglucosamine transferase n=1 Tax=Komagataeibacter diospyri TaxID=1932662 RepID=A0A4P5NX23_9PROT|nr:tetratricopeptide repeat protein [Komagataeibacter diospyri]GCE84854.1 O-linked N-acetylglucosamine transferase [Komagataeibacter diospyri]